MLTNIVLVGENEETLRLAREIADRPYLGYKIISFNKNSAVIKISSINSNFLAELKKHKVDILVIGETLQPDSKITQILYECLKSRIDFWNLPEAYEIICGKIPISFIDKNWFLENLKEGEKDFYDKSKRLSDLILAILLLIISSPFLLLIALAIKIEGKGKVFYKQKRVGKDKKEFFLIKFRSMKEDAEKGKAVWAEKKDLRTTRVGAFLRKTHLDELPQLINIIKGDIALVGPRPERPEFVKELIEEIPYYSLRHAVAPGITGWAQVNYPYGASKKDALAKLEYDLYYIKNLSPLLDLLILARTVRTVLFGKGAR